MANRTVSVNLVANVGQYVGGMNTAAAATMRLGESATSSTKKAKSGFDLASKASLLMGAAVVGGLALAVNKSMEFEKSMSAVAAATQATGGTLNDLRASAMKAGADTAFSATEAADAITEMGKAGVSAKDIMGGGLAGALSLAAAGQIDVAEAAGIASTAMTQFTLAGKDLPHVADLLAAGAGKAMGSVDDLGMALNQAGLIASAAGLSIEETTGTLAAFASAGLLGSDAGTSMKTMLQKLQAPSKEAAQTMSELGINMYDANGNMLTMSGMAGQLKDHMSGLTQEQRNNALATIFGSDAVRAANVLYAQGADGIASWTEKVNDAGYAAKTAAQLQDNLAGDLEKLGGSFDTLMISLGQGAQGPLRELVQMLGGVVDGITWAVEAFSSLPGPVQTAIVGIAALAALRGPLTGLLTAIEVKAVLGASAFLEMALSADTLKTGIVGATLAMAAWGVTRAVGEVIDFTNAGDDAQTMIDELSRSLSGMEGPARLEATSAAVEQLRGELAKYQEIVDSNDNQNWFDKWIWQNPFDSLTDVKDARESIEALKNKIAELDGQGTASFGSIGNSVRSAGAVIAGAMAGVGGAADSTVAKIQVAQQAQEDWLTRLQEIGTAFVEPLGIYQDLLSQKQTAEQESAQATADSTASSTDSWKDYVGDVTVSLDEYATKLEEQLTAQDNWRMNIGIITQRGGLEVGQILTDMGVEGAQIAAQMATAMPAEFERLKNGLIREAQGATVGLDTEMKVMAAVGIDGAGKTAAGISQQLGIGVSQVAAIAKKYGVTLAAGINPLLGALGHPKVTIQAPGGPNRNTTGFFAADGALVEKHDAQIAPGGAWRVWAEPETGGEAYIPLSPAKRSRSVGIWQETGRLLGQYADGGFANAAAVPRPRSTAPFRMPLSTAADATMSKEYDKVKAWVAANTAVMGGGPAGSGAVGGGWASIWQYVKTRIPQARINSTYRAGDPGYHGKGKAIDFGFGSGPGGNGSAGLASINRLIHDGIGKNLAELIYDGIGDDRPDLWHGAPHTYNAGTRAEHHNHVHAAVYDQGGPLHPGYTLAYNGTGKTEWVSKERSGGGSGGGVVIDYARLAAAVGSRSTHITAVAAPNERALAAAIVDRQRDLDFLHA